MYTHTHSTLKSARLLQSVNYLPPTSITSVNICSKITISFQIYPENCTAQIMTEHVAFLSSVKGIHTASLSTARDTPMHDTVVSCLTPVKWSNTI